MKLWRVTPLVKNTVQETQRWTKDGQSSYVIRELTWRWAEFIYQTEDSVAPTFDETVDMFNSGYNMIRSGFLHEIFATSFYYNSEGELESEEDVPPGNASHVLENDGWTMANVQVHIKGDVIIESIVDE